MANSLGGRNDTEKQRRIEPDGIGEGRSGDVGVAAQTETMRIASRAIGGKKTPHAATAVVAAALKPALRTVQANAKRLSKKRTSSSHQFSALPD
jgi:hypothetical protein